MKRKKGDTKENKTDEKKRIIAPLQLGSMLLRLQKAKKRSNMLVRGLRRSLLRSSAITAIRRATILEIVLSQKTNLSCGNFNVSD